MNWFKKGPESMPMPEKQTEKNVGAPESGSSPAQIVSPEERVAKRLEAVAAQARKVKVEPTEQQLTRMADIRRNDLNPVLFAVARGEYASVFEGKSVAQAVALLYGARRWEGDTGYRVTGQNLAPGKQWENQRQTDFFFAPVGTVEHFASLISILAAAGYTKKDIEMAVRTQGFLDMVSKEPGAETVRTAQSAKDPANKALEDVLAKVNTGRTQEDVLKNLQAAIKKTLFAN